jgi:hypothetical protein
MGDKIKEEQDRRDKARSEHFKFVQEAYLKFWKWQLAEGVVAFPFLVGPWVPGNMAISSELGFRKMEDDDRKMIEDQVSQSSGIIMPKKSEIIIPK